MRIALDHAARAAAAGDTPVGAVLLDADRTRWSPPPGNRREQTHDPTAHAELIVLREAARRRQDWRLLGHTLVVTLEPCAMCAGALVLARIERLVFGAYDPKAGAVTSIFDVVRDPRLNHRVDVRGGILEAECGAVADGVLRSALKRRCAHDLIRGAAVRFGSLRRGGVSERPKERASKAREVKASAGSNPAATATAPRHHRGFSRRRGAPPSGRRAACSPSGLDVARRPAGVRHDQSRQRALRRCGGPHRRHRGGPDRLPGRPAGRCWCSWRWAWPWATPARWGGGSTTPTWPRPSASVPWS